MDERQIELRGRQTGGHFVFLTPTNKKYEGETKEERARNSVSFSFPSLVRQGHFTRQTGLGCEGSGCRGRGEGRALGGYERAKECVRRVSTVGKEMRTSLGVEGKK